MNKSEIRTLISAIVFLVSGLTFILSPVSALGITLRIAGAIILIWEIVKICLLVRASEIVRVPLIELIINQFFTIVCATVIIAIPVSAIKIISVIIGIYLLATAAITIFSQLGGFHRSFGEISITAVTVIVGIWLILSPFDILRLSAICIGIALILKAIDTVWSIINSDNEDDDYFYDDRD